MTQVYYYTKIGAWMGITPPIMKGETIMSFQIRHNNSGWYYDLLNSLGEEIACGAYYSTMDDAMLAAERAMHWRQVSMVA